MATTSVYPIHTREIERVREFYREKKGLFGLITWRVTVKTESLGKIVSITIPHLRGIDDLFINGEKITNR